MNRLESYIRDRFEDAVQARREAEYRLGELAQLGEDIADEVRLVAELRGAAVWWEDVMTDLDQGVPAFDALWLVRGDARHALLGPHPRRACRWAQLFADASITDTRCFYDKTAPIQQLTPRTKPTP